MKKETVQKILSETESGYDLIAGKFSDTRKNFWVGLEFVRDFLKDSDKVLDFGCGNGRLFAFLSEKAKIEYVGADISEKLLEKARQLNPGLDFRRLDSGQNTIPFENDYFNACYSIAVFHHFPSGQYRESLAKELFRVTKPGGRVTVTVWNLWQKKYLKNILENWKNKIMGKSEFDWNDCHISFTDNSDNKFQRFHHAFTKGEFKKLFEKAGFETERCQVVGGRNIVYIGKK